MKTLKDRQGCAYLGNKKGFVAVVKSEYIKQAIKDLKSCMDEDGCVSVVTIDKIFGVWE